MSNANSGKEVIDEPWLKTLGWVAIGNTWYPPGSYWKEHVTEPVLFWCRVDGKIRLAGSQWESGHDATREQLLRLLDSLGVAK